MVDLNLETNLCIATCNVYLYGTNLCIATCNVYLYGTNLCIATCNVYLYGFEGRISPLSVSLGESSIVADLFFRPRHSTIGILLQLYAVKLLTLNK